MSDGYVKFWGVRGSIPSPLTAKDVEEKVRSALIEFKASESKDIEAFMAAKAAEQPWTYGGNTSCVEIRYGKTIIILDMGTGVRPFGNSIMPQMFAEKGVEIYIFFSHAHWDHIHGAPFFAPLYINKQTGIKNRWTFHGGTAWNTKHDILPTPHHRTIKDTIEMVLDGQMECPTFPVSWSLIRAQTEKMDYDSFADMREFNLPGGIKFKVRTLNHPQETYGMRIQFPNGKIVTYSTDNEPYDPQEPDDRLLDLAKDADYWITDCQYTQLQYNGYKDDGSSGGVPRRSWGHSYPEAVAETARRARVGQVLLFHHDPGSSDNRVKEMERQTQRLLGSAHKVVAAHEGLVLEL